MASDLTKGSVMGPLVRFTVPLVLGNLFQLTYNAADSIMVGQFVGKDALAAVGAAAPVMNIIMFLVAGACLGAGIAERRGRRRLHAALDPHGHLGIASDQLGMTVARAAEIRIRIHRRILLSILRKNSNNSL